MKRLQELFPSLLPENCQITSPSTAEYNCIAWALGDTSRWWWTSDDGSAYWPSGASTEFSFESIIRMFESLGFVLCLELPDSPEAIAIYRDIDGAFTHVARRLPDGRWTSKIGSLQDITHELKEVESESYGKVSAFLRRG